MSAPVFRLATVADAYEIAVMSRYLVEVGLRGWSWHPERVANAIKPSHQRCSIGRRLVEWLEETSLVAGISTINLELRTNNFGARCFYKMLGFKETAYIPGYYRGVETAVKMSRDIRRAIPHIGQLTSGRAT